MSSARLVIVDVLNDQNHVFGPPIRAIQQRHAIRNPGNRSVRAHLADLYREGPSNVEHPIQQIVKAGDVVGMRQLDQPAAEQLFHRASDDVAVFPVHQHITAREVGLRDTDAGLGEDRSKPLFARLEGPCRTPALAREVDIGADPGKQLARTEGLDQIVVGASLDPLDARLLAGPCREQHQRDIVQLRIASYRAQQPETVESRHHHVAQNRSGRRRRAAFKASSPSVTTSTW